MTKCALNIPPDDRCSNKWNASQRT